MSDESQKRIFEILDSVRNDIAKLSREVGELKVKIESRPFCPRPGACDTLEKSLAELHEEREQAETEIKATIETLERDMGALKSLVERVRGGWITLGLLVTAGGVIGSLITFFFPRK